MERYLQTKNFGSLDGLRCLCILAVVAFHSLPPGGPVTLVNRGFLGVDLFFVISGFLIVTLMLRERSKTGTVSMPKFYLRRVLRIFPAYFLFLGLLAALYLTVSRDSPEAGHFFAALPFELTFTANWVEVAGMASILWSLSTEEQFYLVWPVLQKYLGPKTLLVLLAVVIGVSQVFNFRLFGVSNADLLILQATFTPIALGAVLANVLHRPRGFAFVHRFTGFAGASLVWLAVLAVLLNLPGADISGWHRLAIQTAMVVFLASCVVREDHLLAPVLKWSPVARVGHVSYGVYLYHILALAVVDALMRKAGLSIDSVRFVATLALAVTLAEVSYRFWETPFLKVKDRFASGS